MHVSDLADERQRFPIRSVGSNARFNRFEAAIWLPARFGVDFGQALEIADPAWDAAA